ncbi:MAG TPA: hypothetical protein VJ837_00490 [Candidatus Paceibacterota bacterium]|nr:hypothetical protein [Candidatus Paceibacterota bacterium]
MFKGDGFRLTREAKRSLASDERTHLSGIVPYRERVERQPLALYRPPRFLQKTAPSDEIASLGEILAEMWEFHECYAGCRTKETEILIVLTREYEPLLVRLRSWCERHFQRRLQNRNPKDRDDPFETFRRLLDEFDRIVGHLGSRPGALNYVWLDECSNYTAWFCQHPKMPLQSHC